MTVLPSKDSPLVAEYAPTVWSGVYFIEAVGTGLVKIGFSRNVKRRMEYLRTTCPHELRPLLLLTDGSPALEAELHRQFAHCRVRGEWFRVEDPALLEFIRGDGGSS